MSDSYEINIQGNVSGGQIAAGQNVTQTQTIVPAEVLGADGLAELRAMLAALRADVERETPPEKRAEAEALVDEVEQTLTTAGTPDLSKLDYAKSWFARNVPSVAGAVLSVVVHPLVGQLVTAAGDALVAEFKQRFGG